MNQLTAFFKPLNRLARLILTLSYLYLLAFCIWAIASKSDAALMFEMITQKPTCYVVTLGFMAIIMTPIATTMHLFLVYQEKIKEGREFSYLQLTLDLLAIISSTIPFWLLRNPVAVSQSVNPIITIFAISCVFYFFLGRHKRLTRQVRLIRR